MDISITVKLGRYPLIEGMVEYGSDGTYIYGDLYNVGVDGLPTGSSVATAQVPYSQLPTPDGSGGIVWGDVTFSFTNVPAPTTNLYILILSYPYVLTYTLNGEYIGDSGVWWCGEPIGGNLGNCKHKWGGWDINIESVVVINGNTTYTSNIIVGYSDIIVGGAYNQQLYFRFAAPQQNEKAINPTPVDAQQNVTCLPSLLLSWEPGDPDSPPDYYQVYIGNDMGWEYTIDVSVPYVEYDQKFWGPSTKWRVDSVYGEDIVEGDVWSFYPSHLNGLTMPQNPTPVNNSTVGNFNGITLRWEGEPQATSFVLSWRKNSGTWTTVNLDSRKYKITAVSPTDYVEWKVSEKASTFQLDGETWAFNVAQPDYPSIYGAVPMPNSKRVVIACDDKLFYGRLE